MKSRSVGDSHGVETYNNAKKHELVRGLGYLAATAVVIGSMIGQAVFLVASDMSREVGSMWKVLVVWTTGGVIVLIGALCYAELGAAMPEAGGDYVYLGRGVGPLGGFLYGWTFSLIMRPGAAAGIAAGLVRFIGFLAPSVTAPIFVLSLHSAFLSWPYQLTFTAAQPIAAAVVVFATVLNYWGVRSVGHVQIFLTALKIATVIDFCANAELWIGTYNRGEYRPAQVATGIYISRELVWGSHYHWPLSGAECASGARLDRS